MSTPIVPEDTPAVNSEQPIKVRDLRRRLFWLSVTRACGHCEYVPADAGDDPVGYAAAARADIPCHACERAAAPPADPRPQAVTVRIQTGARPQGRTRPTADEQAADALFWVANADSFFQVLDAGQVQASDMTIAGVTRIRNRALRVLHKLGRTA